MSQTCSIHVNTCCFCASIPTCAKLLHNYSVFHHLYFLQTVPVRNLESCDTRQISNIILNFVLFLLERSPKYSFTVISTSLCIIHYSIFLITEIYFNRQNRQYYILSVFRAMISQLFAQLSPSSRYNTSFLQYNNIYYVQ